MSLLSRAKNTWRRLCSASLPRMKLHVDQIHKECGRSSLSIGLDMVWCMLRYGVGYLDYHVFGFGKNRGKCRKTFMTMSHNNGLTRLVCRRELYPLLNDKARFLEFYGDFLGRQWLDLRQCREEQLEALLQRCPVVFAKVPDSFGGQGVERIQAGQEPVHQLWQRLVQGGQVLVEEGIQQHPELNRLNPASVNTLRITTLMANGQARFLYGLIRVGSGESHVDNISSGGMYTLIGPQGLLEFPAFCDKTGQYYQRHPVTQTPFPGFRIPFYQEAVELCLQAAAREPGLGYIGWDVAITPTGPVLVEGNLLPGYDMPQNACFHPQGQGLLPVFEAALGGPIPRA